MVNEFDKRVCKFVYRATVERNLTAEPYRSRASDLSWPYIDLLKAACVKYGWLVHTYDDEWGCYWLRRWYGKTRYVNFMINIYLFDSAYYPEDLVALEFRTSPA
jgi:hypothetical protein